MSEIKNISKLTNPDEILFVADGMTGQDAVNSAKQFNKDLPLSGIVLSKMDGDAKGGAAVSIKEIIGKPIKFLGTSEKIDGLDLFDPARIADRILGYGDVVALVNKAQTLFDDQSAKRLEQSIKRNTFTLDDYRKQLIQIKKMGSINDIMKILPVKMKNIHTDEKSLIWIEAIINSMTKYERKNPSVLDGSRRLRISKGSGRSVQEVNALLNQFSKMQKVMRKMGKMNKKRIPNLNGMFGFR
jgi:Signal recognition particle GTPase